VSLLKLSPKTNLIIRESDFANFKMNNIPTSETTARKQKRFRSCSITRKSQRCKYKVAKCLLSLSFIGGYTSLGLKNVVTVQNAINM
jgi:hypothetical protein